MLRLFALWIVCAMALRAVAAEREFDFSQFPVNQTPKGFRSVVTGTGQPGDWKILMEDVPPLLAPITPNAPAVARQAVLAQLARDPADEHFPLLIVGDEVYGDFTFTTRFKAVAGEVEQMAGVAFRIQDEKNYYVVRASAKGGTFRFYKFVEGVRTDPIGPETPIPAGVWHELTVECKGNQIRCLLNGRELIPALTDNSFNAGKIGFWTKSDSVSYFTSARIRYTPRELLIQSVLRDTLAKYPRVLGLKVFARLPGQADLKAVAAKDEKEVGEAGGQTEADVIQKGAIFFGRSKDSVTVTLPLRDRNGETVAAVRVTLTSFIGQMEQTAIARALPIVKVMEDRVKAAKDLTE